MNDGKPLTLPADLAAEQNAKSAAVEYLISLGDAHRDLWVRRLKKGMKPALKARFDSLVAEYAALPNATTSSAEPTFERVLPYDEENPA